MQIVKNCTEVKAIRRILEIMISSAILVRMIRMLHEVFFGDQDDKNVECEVRTPHAECRTTERTTPQPI